jgi:hypothetical protein
MDDTATATARALIASLEPLLTCDVGPLLEFRHGDGECSVTRPALWYDATSNAVYCDACRAEIDHARADSEQPPLAWRAV